MFKISKLFLVILVVVFASCRDTKKEAVENENSIPEKVEAVDTEYNEISNEIEKEEEELEKELKELDKI